MPILATNDIQTAYDLHGHGPPLVLIHGALVDRRMWQPQIGPFAEDYTVITYDLRGHGQTGRSARRSYSVQLLADDLRALLQTLKVEGPIVCGLSLGGMVAQAYAVAYPADLSALVLCDTAVSVTLTLSDKLQTYGFGWSLAPTVRLMGARRFTDYAVAMARWTRGEAWFGQNAEVRDYVQGCMRAFDTTEMAKVYKMITDFREVDLSRIAVPTLVVNGEHESRSVYRHTQHLLARVPGARAVTIPDAGHTANMENPSAFNQAVLGFLASSLKARAQT